MNLRRRKVPPLPPRPEREPDIYIDGKPMWVVIPAPVASNGAATYSDGKPFTVLG